MNIEQKINFNNILQNIYYFQTNHKLFTLINYNNCSIDNLDSSYVEYVNNEGNSIVMTINLFNALFIVTKKLDKYKKLNNAFNKYLLNDIEKQNLLKLFNIYILINKIKHYIATKEDGVNLFNVTIKGMLNDILIDVNDVSNLTYDNFNISILFFNIDDNLYDALMKLFM